jgi:hypothetical protein
MEGGKINIKIYSKFLEFTRMWLQGFYTAVNFKLTLKESQEKLLLMKMCKSIWNTRINKENSNWNWNNNYQVSAVIGHHIKSFFWSIGSHWNRAQNLCTQVTMRHSGSSSTFLSLIFRQKNCIEWRLPVCFCLVGLLFFSSVPHWVGSSASSGFYYQSILSLDVGYFFVC